jgi:hypothetical protein
MRAVTVTGSRSDLMCGAVYESAATLKAADNEPNDNARKISRFRSLFMST